MVGPSFASQTLGAALERDACDVEIECTALARAGRFVKEIEPAHSLPALHRRGYRWIGALAPEAAPAERLAERTGPVLVGRDAALAQLDAAAATAASGRRQIVFVTGEPGRAGQVAGVALVASLDRARRGAPWRSCEALRVSPPARPSHGSRPSC